MFLKNDFILKRGTKSFLTDQNFYKFGSYFTQKHANTSGLNKKEDGGFLQRSKKVKNCLKFELKDRDTTKEM